MAFYDNYIDKILHVIDEDRENNLDFMIYQDLYRILDEMMFYYCNDCDVANKNGGEDDYEE